MPDWLDELQDAIAARALLAKTGDPQDSRQKIIADIKRALTYHFNQKEHVDNVRHPYVGMMVKAHEMAESTQHGSDGVLTTIVVVESALSKHNIVIPIAEVGVDSICFVSQSSPMGGRLLSNAERIQQEVVERGSSMVVFIYETKDGSVDVVWNITALYPPEETREIILKHLHRVEVGSF